MSRDLTGCEKVDLELLVDATGLESLLQALSELCGAVSEIVAVDQQDAARAKRWATMEGALGVLSTKARGL